MQKWVIVQVAALGWDLVERTGLSAPGLSFQPAESVFPALTCTAQATLRTGSPPGDHGMIANGRYFRSLRKVLFWEQAADLVEGPRIWADARGRGRKVGMMFWQQSLGEAVDLLLSPKPVHKHGGGMIQDCYCRPGDLYRDLSRRIGRRFQLMHYWGPFTSARATDWIVASLQAAMEGSTRAPDILFGYLPHLDYDLQRHGPGTVREQAAADRVGAWLAALMETARKQGYELVVAGDYAIGAVEGGAVYLNRALRNAGLFRVQSVRGMAYPDFFSSAGLAMVDHEIAQVFVQDLSSREAVLGVLRSLDGVGDILDAAAQSARGVRHSGSGEFLVVAAPGHWFAYPWWEDPREAPDFAGHVDIHNKPGFDPCELFLGWPPGSVSRDPDRIRGTHGRGGPGRRIAWASSAPFAQPIVEFSDLASALVQAWQADGGE